MLTSDGKYRSPEAVERRKRRMLEKQTDGRYNKNEKRWIDNNPEKRKAHIAVGNAVRDGKLIKPDTCPRCGRKTRIIGHHDDYSKPLEVEWMCSKCHRLEHEQ